MEICDEPSRLCFKINSPALDKFNVIYHKEASVTLLWNKYEILLYEGDVCASEQHKFVPDFVIQNVLISINYLICLDTNCTVYTTRLKSKNQKKRLKNNFLPQMKNIVSIFQQSKDKCLCLNSKSGMFLTVHYMSADFECIQKIQLTFIGLPHLTSCCLTSYTVPDNKLHFFNKIFKGQAKSGFSLVLLSLDSRNVHACFVNLDNNETTPVNLFDSPAVISSVAIIEMNSLEILIGLKAGTIIRITIGNNIDLQLIHLTTALHKFQAVKDTLFYTDGCTMWRVTNTFSKNPNFTELFVKQVKDFTIYDNQAICVTYSNLLYKFPLESCTNPKTDYLPVERLSNSGLMQKLMEEIERNDQIVQKLTTELNYLSALAFSIRSDLRDKLVEYTVTVYDNYQNVKQYTEANLTNKLHKYFESNSVMFHLKVTLSKRWKVIELLSTFKGKLRLQATFSIQGRVLKTTSILLTEILNETNLLIPLKFENYTEVHLDLVLVADIPAGLAGLDANTELSTVLYKKAVIVSSENFIKSSQNKDVQNKTNAQYLILESAVRHHGDLFKLSKTTFETNEYCFSNNLPKSFADTFKKKEIFTKHLNEQIAAFLWNKMSTEDFLNGKSPVSIQIGSSKLELLVVFNVHAVPVLTLRGDDVKVLNNMRNFFARILWRSNENCERKMFVPHRLHTSLHIMKRSLKRLEGEDCYDQSQTLEMTSSFMNNVISYLPF